jgi:hypothetical protein
MRHLYLFLFVFTFILAGQAQSPDSVFDVFHQPVHLDTTDSRKLLIILLPARPDTALAGQLLRFQARHRRQVRIIAILAPGAGPSAAGDHSNVYGKLSSVGVVLTEGMADTDSAAGRRSSFLKYVSCKNRHRQTDLFAEGSKYFISEKGRVFAQFGKNTSLDSRLADYIVQTMVPGED